MLFCNLRKLTSLMSFRRPNSNIKNATTSELRIEISSSKKSASLLKSLHKPFVSDSNSSEEGNNNELAQINNSSSSNNNAQVQSDHKPTLLAQTRIPIDLFEKKEIASHHHEIGSPHKNSNKSVSSKNKMNNWFHFISNRDEEIGEIHFQFTYSTETGQQQ